MIRMIQRIDTEEPPFGKVVCRRGNAQGGKSVTGSGLTEA
jgi:hypothetical protein